MQGRRKYWIWALLSLPALWITARWQMEFLTYGGVIHVTGLWSAAFLILALTATPLRRLFPKAIWPRRLMYHRRAIGVASFGYAAFHTGVYLWRKIPLGKVISEGSRPDLLTGWLAFFIFAILAVTSNRASLKRLGKHWQVLHRSVYLAAALMYVHWMLSVFEYRWALGSLIFIAALELTRLRKS